jgi:hypothetical protein
MTEDEAKKNFCLADTDSRCVGSACGMGWRWLPTMVPYAGHTTSTGETVITSWTERMTREGYCGLAGKP